MMLKIALSALLCIGLAASQPTKGRSNEPSAFASPIRVGEVSGQESVTNAAKYLQKFGYTALDFNTGTATEDSLSTSLKNFQYFSNLPITGKLDDNTVQQMEKSRCGMKDPRVKFKYTESGKARYRRFTLQGETWDFTSRPDRILTWHLQNTYHFIEFNKMKQIISYAFSKWEAVTNVNFRQSRSKKADIIVKFAPGSHGDPYAFDGRGGTLAHAYYPYRNYDLGGDIHFDSDEEFTFEKSYGTNILWVAVHEAGHSLGLEHSNLKDAVMYPWYKGPLATDFDLRPDDINGVQALYGKRPQTTPSPTIKPETTAPPTTTPEPVAPPTTTPEPVAPPTATPIPTDPPTTTPKTTQGPVTEPDNRIDCMKKVDAAVVDSFSGWMFVFSGKEFYLVSRHKLQHGPMKYTAYFRDLKKDVTAAYVRKRDNTLVLFTGDKYFLYRRFALVQGERPVTDFGLPAGVSVDAALQWQGNSRTRWVHGSKTYLFAGKDYYRFDEQTRKIDSYYPRKVSTAWRGLPSQITAAVMGFDRDGRGKETYFIAGNYFYIFDNEKIAVKAGYPKHVKTWLKCASKDPGSLAVGNLHALDERSEAGLP